MEISRQIKLLIAQYKVFPSDRLGQNFLIGSSALDFVLKAINPKEDRSYIEVGAGFLYITKLIAVHSQHVFAIEKDKRFAPYYKDFFESGEDVVSKVEIIQDDALKVDFNKLNARELCGNIPYYISSDLLVKIAYSSKIERAVILFQKEFADRILAHPNTSEYSAITVLVDFYFDKKFLKTFPESFFYPRPTVSSTFVELTRHKTPNIKEEDFFKFVRASFGMRRKKITNNLKSLFPQEKIEKALTSIGLDVDVRAEKLSCEDFISLYKAVHELDV
jgi:16S rRNA (adenine1518-N6/adenine1519-N6)-dimethyltransferase